MVVVTMAAGIMGAAGTVTTGVDGDSAGTGIMTAGVETGTTTGGAAMMDGAAGNGTATTAGMVTANSMAMGTETDAEWPCNIAKRLASKIASRFFLRADFEACIEAELNEDVFIRRLRKVLRKPEGKRSWAVLLIVLEPLPAFGNGRNLARRNPP